VYQTRFFFTEQKHSRQELPSYFFLDSRASSSSFLIRRSDIPENIILVVILIVCDNKLALKQCNIHIHITILHEGGIGLGQGVIPLEQLAA